MREHLGPALLHTYIAVDTAEGVDVDKEDFEKYGARYGLPPATITHAGQRRMALQLPYASLIIYWQ